MGCEGMGLSPLGHHSGSFQSNEVKANEQNKHHHLRNRPRLKPPRMFRRTDIKNPEIGLFLFGISAVFPSAAVQ
jgi:hypothetical protein